MKTAKFILTALFLVLFSNKAFAVDTTGEASVYKITMTYLELCETGSTTASCSNPLAVGSGDSGLINIADTTAGVAAASYGDFTTVPFGTSYSHYQVTMKRAVKIKGSVSDGTNTCYTASDSGDISKNVVGSTSSGDEAEITAYMAMTVSSLGDEINSISAGDGTGTAQDAGTVDDDDEYFQYRGAFTKVIKLEPGKIPTLQIAFGTSSALAYKGSDGGCTATIGQTQGLYGGKPDVTATVID
ncbi:MAG: hypothetical protein HOM22_03230 [Candidatus Marinimicrobia bacterium]|jgi:hypothetical protein|nr:hypothetical protein [Candidatus Neomarinimicrobiota bacterium]